MRKKAYTGKLLLFALLFLGCSNFMNAHSQTNTWLASYTQSRVELSSQGEQARAISSILSEARKAFDVDFIYESKILPGAKLVMDVEKFKTVEEFLDELLRPYNLKYKKVLAKAYVIYSSNSELKRLLSIIVRQDGVIPDELLHQTGGAASASIVISGRILEDGKGAPVEGVSISVRGTNRGTVTDKDGAFRLEVDNEKAVLFVSLSPSRRNAPSLSVTVPRLVPLTLILTPSSGAPF